MNKGYLLILAVVSMLAAGCTKEFDQALNSVNYVTRTYTAGIADDTKTSVDEEGNVTWKAGDVVRYYSEENGTVGECTVAENGSSTDLTMNVAPGASSLVAVCGGTSLSGNTLSGVTVNGAIPTEQSGIFGDSHIVAVKSDDLSKSVLKFHNMVSYLKFTLEETDVKKVVLSSNDGTALSGNGEVILSFSGENVTASFGSSTSSSITVNTDGAGTFYIATLPCTLSSGFKIECYDKYVVGEWDYDIFPRKVVSEKSVTIKPGTILDLGTLDSRIYNDLSEDGTANCYIVHRRGNYRFNAAVKGGSEEEIGGAPCKAEVLWESFGTQYTNISEGDLVSYASYSDGCITFSTTGKTGNAVIALEDADNTILWSWHIWMPELGVLEDEPNLVCYNNGGYMMDRNLGAVTATKGDEGAYGLWYQWGRKDPFPGFRQLATIKVPSAESKDPSFEYIIKNPTVFINDTPGRGEGDFGWTPVADGEKGIFDPCPRGWRVPDGGEDGIWAQSAQGDWSWDSENNGVDFGNWYGKDEDSDEDSWHTGFFGPGGCWYPGAGWMGGFEDVYDLGRYWASNGYPGVDWAYCLIFGRHEDDLELDTHWSCSAAMSVRCCQDNY